MTGLLHNISQQVGGCFRIPGFLQAAGNETVAFQADRFVTEEDFAAIQVEISPVRAVIFDKGMVIVQRDGGVIPRNMLVIDDDIRARRAADVDFSVTRCLEESWFVVVLEPQHRVGRVKICRIAVQQADR